MRRLARTIVVAILRILAKAVIRRFRPRVVAITGSVGKTTTKDLTTAMLGTQFRVRGAKGSYNSEFGVPLTILGCEVGFSVVHWLKVVKRGVSLLAGSKQKANYPEVLVLEMGADHPGDIQYVTGIAQPDVAIVTNVRGVHLVNYDGIEAIAEEKSWIVRNLQPEGTAILNFDDTKVRMMQALAPRRSVTYGLNDDANVWAEDIRHSIRGMSATIKLRQASGNQAAGTLQSWPVTTPLLGRHQLYGVLAAFAAAVSVGVPAKEALTAAAQVGPPPGRLRVLPGVDNLTLLDDTYNASPQAMIASLEVLRDFPGPRRAVLGSMRELGPATESGHRSVGEYVAPWLDQLVVVGDDAALIAEAAASHGMDPDKIAKCESATDAPRLLERHGGGTVLFKASQSVYLERAVSALLKDPRDERLLLQRLKQPEHRPV